jgi:hypothetical protein
MLKVWFSGIRKVFYHSASDTMTGKWRLVKADNMAY